jgi:beta-glucosidase
VQVVHEPGCAVSRGTPPLDVRLLRTAGGEHGLGLEVSTTGERLLARRSQLRWSGGAAVGTATLTPRQTGTHTFKLRAQCAASLSIDGVEVTDGSGAGAIDLVAGREYALRLDAAPAEGSPLVGVDIRCREPVPDDLFDRAVTAARDADAVVLVLGLDNEWETEGRDRDDLGLPGNQDQLVERVRAANPCTVVVVNAGSPVAMPWVERAPAVVQLWYPGQEGGNALADVLFGDINPSGRLPTTFPRRLEDTPAFLNYPPEGGQMVYGEGLFVGYRWYDARLIEPLFPFGHGLSYTTFSYGELVVDGDRASLDVTNDGDVAGVETVQLYISDVEASVARPRKELKAFARVRVEPGATATVSFDLVERMFTFWDVDQRTWRTEPGEFELLAGASAGDIRAHATYLLGPT